MPKPVVKSIFAFHLNRQMYSRHPSPHAHGPALTPKRQAITKAKRVLCPTDRGSPNHMGAKRQRPQPPRASSRAHALTALFSPVSNGPWPWRRGGTDGSGWPRRFTDRGELANHVVNPHAHARPGIGPGTHVNAGNAATTRSTLTSQQRSKAGAPAPRDARSARAHTAAAGPAERKRTGSSKHGIGKVRCRCRRQRTGLPPTISRLYAYHHLHASNGQPFRVGHASSAPAAAADGGGPRSRYAW